MKTCGVEPLLWSGSSCRDGASCRGGDKRSIFYLRCIHGYAQGPEIPTQSLNDYRLKPVGSDTTESRGIRLKPSEVFPAQRRLKAGCPARRIRRRFRFKLGRKET